MKCGERVLLKQYKNGNKVWGVTCKCEKCGGVGVIPQFYHVASGTCFDCNGTGMVQEKEYEYTPEWLAKREAKLARERAKWEAEEAEREAQREAERAEEERREAERLAEIERNRGQFIGNVGDKIELEVTFVRKFSYETHFGWQTMYVSGHVFKTDDGNTIIYKTTGSPLHYDVEKENGYWDTIFPEEGERMTIRGTIKAHEEYNNVNQTILQRVKWVRK